MSLTVNGVNNVSSVNAATGSSNVPENEDVLFEAAESNDVNKPADKNLEMLEAKLADLQAELKTLETEKAQKEAYKKELEVFGVQNSHKTIWRYRYREERRCRRRSCHCEAGSGYK